MHQKFSGGDQTVMTLEKRFCKLLSIDVASANGILKNIEHHWKQECANLNPRASYEQRLPAKMHSDIDDFILRENSAVTVATRNF